MNEIHKIKSGFFWLTSGAIVQNLSKILIIGILSRLLSSEAFGVVTIASTVTGIAELFTQISLGKSLVQMQVITKNHIKVAFTFSLISTLILSVLFIFIVNPIVSSFFTFPDLEKVLNALAILFPIRGFSQLSFALLQREKAFKSLAGLEAIAYIIGYGLVATIMAWFGFGVWSLVYGSLAIALVYSVLLYARARFELRIGFDFQSFKELFGFGAKYSFIKIVNYGALKGDYLVVGKVLGAASLGIYSRAYTIMDSVNAILGKVLYTLLFPFFAGTETDSTKKTELILKIIGITVNVILPLSAICSLYSDKIIFLLLGDQWTEAVLIFRILVVSMLARVGYKVVSSFLLGADTINDNLLIQSLYCVLIILGTYVGSLFFGLVGSAIAVSLVLYVIFFLFTYVLIKSYKTINITDLLLVSKPGIALTAGIILANTPLFFFLQENDYHLLIEFIIIVLINFCFLLAFYTLAAKVFFAASLINIINSVTKRVLLLLRR